MPDWYDGYVASNHEEATDGEYFVEQQGLRLTDWVAAARSQTTRNDTATMRSAGHIR